MTEVVEAPFAEEIRQTWVEIDLCAFERNVDALSSRLREGVRLIALLKADAYGHGAVELARRCRPEKVAMIGTALLEEAVELRRAGISIPLMILGPMAETQIRTAVDLGIVIGVPGPEEMKPLVEIAQERDVAIHLKIDSGMGRMGTLESELNKVAAMILSAPRLRLDGIYSHLATASDPAEPYTLEQIRRFEGAVAQLEVLGVTAPHLHIANSAAIIQGIDVPGDLVRAGIALLGAAPLDTESTRFEPVMRWRTTIARLKELPAGHPVGYGITWRAERPSRIATLPVGYADGYNRALSNRGEVLVRGRRAPVIGRVSMDLVTVDVTDIEDAEVGDEVVLLGTQGDEEISAEELALKIGTISYEVFCAVSARVPRVYVDETSPRIRSRFHP